jgi:hypothetical protein
VRVFKLSRENVPENPFPPSHKEGGSAEFTMDDLGFFQEIDVPPALGAVGQDLDLRFLSSVHGLIIYWDADERRKDGQKLN